MTTGRTATGPADGPMGGPWVGPVIVAMGDTGLLVDLAAPGPESPAGSGLGPLGLARRVLAVDRLLRTAPDRPAAVTDLVPAAQTVLVRFDPGAAVGSAVAAWVSRVLRQGPDGDPPRSVAPHGGPPSGQPSGLSSGQPSGQPSGPVVLEVVYDGADLAEVGALTGLGAAGVVAVHTGTLWTVAFTGFAPGFGYLVGDAPQLHVPRLPTPRPRVPPGAVALGGGYCGVYPRASPGGWRLIGTTRATLWREDGDPPALLTPGTTVRFVAVDR